MSSFLIAYNKFIKPFEGGYVNHPADKGGETYAGIARNKFPQWEGWRLIDHYKAAQASVGQTLRHNQMFPELQTLVDAFYESRWNSNSLSKIENQNIASLLFDYIIHSGTTKAVRAIQNIVGVNTDGIIGPKTLAAINRGDSTKIFVRLLNERANFLRRLVQNDPTQKVFEDGWNNRIATFRKLLPPNVAGGIVAAAILFTLIYTLA